MLIIAYYLGMASQRDSTSSENEAWPSHTVQVWFNKCNFRKATEQRN